MTGNAGIHERARVLSSMSKQEATVVSTSSADHVSPRAAMRAIEGREDVLEVNQGSLYPALYRLEDRGLITATWGISPEGRRAKFYALTKAGRKQAGEEQAAWQLFTTAVNHALKGAGA